ncbi:hypothetical protein [uncultured Aquimarina sp.]|uniref:hypothetical protein n=2 Tax=uncultured Aquimarina sp. TaxID=575652 RepID=UPI00262FF670|nr:hypothetical protein [uncultured Aquimarina sp.]
MGVVKKIHIYYMLICCYCVSTITAYGQDQLSSEDQKSVFSILEKDRDGTYLKDGKPKENFVNNKIVDINSVLQIDLDYSAIVSEIEKNGAGLPDDIDKKIKMFSEAMRLREKNLDSFNTLLNTYNYRRFKENSQLNKEWANKMQKVALAITDLGLSLEDNGVELKSFRPEYIYNAAQNELKQLTNQVENFANNEGVYIQFGAWLYTKNNKSDSVHLPGFDSIKPKQPYEVERWQILPTEEQQKQLEELSALANKNKNNGLSALRDVIDIQIEHLKQTLKVEFTSIVSQITQDIEQISDPQLNQFITDFNSFKSDLENFEIEIRKRISFYENLKINDQTSFFQVVSQIESDINFITKEDGKQLLDKAVSLYDQVKNLVNIQNLKKYVNDLKVYLEKWVRIISDSNSVQSIEALILGTPIDFSLLKFSDKVFKLSLANMPTQTDLDLFTTGIRGSGDRIAFKFEINSKKKLIYRENREVYMYRILPHIESTVGVIFADPLARTNVKTQFQMAPYYNLILKGLWDQKIRRRSVAYNRIFDWGIGLHISAPDFDGDDVPELGAGLVVSILHDYVQTGAAINVFTGDPYWYFGLRLPVPSFNIGSIPMSSN